MNKWIDINKELPKNGTEVLAREHDGEVYRLEFKSTNEGLFWLSRSGYYYHAVTHWMDFPNEPVTK